MSRLSSAMMAGGAPVFGILDAARGSDMCRRFPCTTRVRSLYADKEEELELQEVAPYLVAAGEDPAFLERLVTDGWGRSSGVYLSCRQPFDEVLTHVSSFLKVKTEGGEILYFRFYDPRVLRVFLPSCTVEQAAEFFGPVQAFWVEAEDLNSCLVFRRGNTGVSTQTIGVRNTAPGAKSGGV